LSLSNITVGFLVNPVAGCGLKYNLKGSDHLKYEQCLDSTSVKLATSFLAAAPKQPVKYLVPEGLMGSIIMKRAGITNFEVIYIPKERTTRRDTIEFARLCDVRKVDLIICFGGDGTLRDLCDAGIGTPVLAVPAGTKMFSGGFAVNLDEALDRFNRFCISGNHNVRKGDVVDLDENKYIEGNLAIRPYCQLNIVAGENAELQSKAEYPPEGSLDAAEYVVDTLEEGVNYLIGPGNTCKNILRLLRQEGSLMGFDILRGRKVLKTDVTSADIRNLAEKGMTRVILSPTGDQGFLLGRGNRQLDPYSIEKIGFSNIIIISSREKLSRLKKLYCDFQGVHVEHPKYVRVLIGYGSWKVMPLEA